MKKYTFGALLTVSVFTEVMANSEEEALDIAESRDVQGLCHHCASGNEATEWSLTGELDGIPQEITLDERQ